jgi:hypothetical protein
MKSSCMALRHDRARGSSCSRGERFVTHPPFFSSVVLAPSRMVPPILSFDPSGMNIMAASEKIKKEGGGRIKEGRMEEDVGVSQFTVPW